MSNKKESTIIIEGISLTQESIKELKSLQAEDNYMINFSTDEIAEFSFFLINNKSSLGDEYNAKIEKHLCNLGHLYNALRSFKK